MIFEVGTSSTSGYTLDRTDLPDLPLNHNMNQNEV